MSRQAPHHQPGKSQPGPIVSLAAGTVLDATPEQTIHVAARAGYDGVGLRLDPATVTPRQAQRLADQIDANGLALLDVEVVRLEPRQSIDSQLRLLELAHLIGSRFLLTVSEHPDLRATELALGRLYEAAAGSGVRVAVEFMRFTGIHSLRDALAVLERVAPADQAVVVVDALHLHRGGETPSDVASAPAHRIGYLQLCDAAELEPEELATEARHHRLAPGQGILPLRQLVNAAPPGTPVSVEVQSDRLYADMEPAQRATYLREAARAVLTTPADGKGLPCPQP